MLPNSRCCTGHSLARLIPRASLLWTLKLVLRSTLEASGPVTIECLTMNQVILTFSVSGTRQRTTGLLPGILADIGIPKVQFERLRFFTGVERTKDDVHDRTKTREQHTRVHERTMRPCGPSMTAWCSISNGREQHLPYNKRSMTIAYRRMG